MSRGAMHNYDNKTKLGQIISIQLCQIGKNQKWLALECDVTDAHISMVLTGKSKPSNLLLYKISKALGIDCTVLIRAMVEIRPLEVN